jgi:hypothetical protein
MSSNSCILAFLAVLLFDLLVIVVWLVAKPDRDYLTAKEALDEIKQSNHFADKCFALLVYLSRFIGKGLLAFVLALSLGAFGCLGSICLGDSAGLLQNIRLILQDFYAFIERIVVAR